MEKEQRAACMDWGQLQDFVTDAFISYGVPERDAALCADVLLESDRRGIRSHGCNRLKPIYLDRIEDGIQKPVTQIDVVAQQAATIVLDANDGMGMVASRRAMELAMKKAREYGLGMAAVRNSTHYGIAGYWASMAVEEGMIGITGTNARPSIAPTFGIENLFGTNPLTIGMPTDEECPFLLDCSTSSAQRGKIERLARLGQDTPPGMAVGRDGAWLTDSKSILRGLKDGTVSLTTDYKGYGYATAVELLSAALQGGSYLKMLTDRDELGNQKPYHLGHFFLVIDPEAFCGRSNFERIAGNILRTLRAAARQPSENRIYTAGEKEWLAKQENTRHGFQVEIPLQRDLIAIRDKKQLPYRFPFE